MFVFKNDEWCTKYGCVKSMYLVIHEDLSNLIPDHIKDQKELHIQCGKINSINKRI